MQKKPRLAEQLSSGLGQQYVGLFQLVVNIVITHSDFMELLSVNGLNANEAVLLFQFYQGATLLDFKVSNLYGIHNHSVLMVGTTSVSSSTSVDAELVCDGLRIRNFRD